MLKMENMLLYLHSILEEFHTGQESARTIMRNDKQDLER